MASTDVSPPSSPLKAPPKWVGESLPSNEGEPIVTGSLEYVTDRHLPDMLHGVVVRSTVPHAEIRVDTRPAQNLPGVVAVLTAPDVPVNQLGADPRNGPVLADTRVRQVGEAIALVAATDKETARQAAQLVEVEYRELPVVDAPGDPSAPSLHDGGNVGGTILFEANDVDAALAESSLVIETLTHTQAQEHAALETPGGVAQRDDLGRITIWCGSQNPGLHRALVATALNIGVDDVRLVSNPVGGAFGSRNDDPMPVYLALLAYLTRRPVHIHLTRQETMIAGPKRHPYRTTVRVGFDEAGYLQAIDMSVLADTGPYITSGRHVLKTSAEMATGAYASDAARFDGTVEHTNNANAGAFRGYGVPQVALPLELSINRAAQLIGHDPIELRLKNLIPQGGRHALYGHPIGSGLRSREALEAAARHEWWSDREAWEESAEAPWVRSTGIAMAIKGVGMGSGRGDTARARLIVSADGHVTIWAGPNHTGQAIATTYRQIAVDALGLDPDRVEVVVGDSELVPESGPTAASRSTYAGGNAVKLVCEKLRTVLDATPSGEPFEETATALVETGQAEYQAEFALPDVPEPGRISQSRLSDHAPHAVYGCSVQVARVEINSLTGEVRVGGVLCVVDAGRVVNPVATVGQAVGGVVQGLGFAIMEEYRLRNSVPVTVGFETYLIPTAVDVPPIETILLDGFEETGPFGAKGMSEVVVVPTAPAIASAVGFATGFWPVELPMTAERVLEGLSAREAA